MLTKILNEWYFVTKYVKDCPVMIPRGLADAKNLIKIETQIPSEFVNNPLYLESNYNRKLGATEDQAAEETGKGLFYGENVDAVESEEEIPKCVIKMKENCECAKGDGNCNCYI